MLRICLGMFLVCASAHVMAQSSRNSSTSNNASACEEAVARDTALHHPGIAHPRTIASRAKAAKSAVIHTTTAASNAGGSSGDGDATLPRQRGAKWQSFLPGMFR